MYKINIINDVYKKDSRVKLSRLLRRPLIFTLVYEGKKIIQARVYYIDDEQTVGQV